MQTKNNPTPMLMEKIKADVKLGAWTTFGIGGQARYFAEARSIEEMQDLILWAKTNDIALFIMGKGSNLLFDDKGFNGLVIVNKISFIEEQQPGMFYVGAGYSFSLLGVQTARKGWGGLEFASGIPASVGGAIFMNAGANGACTSETLVSVDFINTEGKFIRYRKEELAFAYRHSSFHNMAGAIVASAFQLKNHSAARQRQLEIIQYRKDTQPLQEMSAGCVFRNTSQGLAAGALIEQAGLKGCHIAGAKVSEKHANFILNDGTATCESIKSLVTHVQDKVLQVHGIALEREVRMIDYEGRLI